MKEHVIWYNRRDPIFLQYSRLYSGDETGKIIVHDFLNPPEKSTIQNIEDKTLEQENKSSNETADNVEDLNKNEDLINKAKKPKLNTNDM